MARSGLSAFSVLRIMVYGAAHLIVSSVVFVSFVGNGALGVTQSPGAFLDMVNGTASKPYVYRMLLPSLIRFFSDITPAAVRRNIEKFLQGKSFFSEYFHTDYSLEYAYGLALVFLCFIGCSMVFRLLARHFYPGRPLHHCIGSLGGMLVVPIFFVTYRHYLYDPATIFLFSMAILLIVRRNTMMFFFFLPLTALQKETSVLLIALYAMSEFRRRSNKGLFLIVILLCAEWAAIKLCFVNIIFWDNPGSPALFQLVRHNLVLYKFPLPALYCLCVVIAMTLVVSHGWKEKSLFLRQGLTITGISLAALMVPFGFVDELRDLYEIVPFLILLMTPSIADIIARRSESVKSGIL